MTKFRSYGALNKLTKPNKKVSTSPSEDLPEDFYYNSMLVFNNNSVNWSNPSLPVTPPLTLNMNVSSYRNAPNDGVCMSAHSTSTAQLDSTRASRRLEMSYSEDLNKMTTSPRFSPFTTYTPRPHAQVLGNQSARGGWNLLSNSCTASSINVTEGISSPERVERPSLAVGNVDEPEEVPMIISSKEWRVERGARDVDISTMRLEFIDSNRHTLWYEKFFTHKEHCNYVGFDKSGDPVFVSLEKITKENQRNAIEGNMELKIRALIRTCSPFSSKETDDEWVFLPGDCKSIKKALLQERPKLFNSMKLYRVDNPLFDIELAQLEKKLVVLTYKFGIVNVKEGQIEENEIFQNTNPSPQFEDFLNFLGNRIELQSHVGFRGGLDVKTNTTGHQSIYTKMEDHGIEIMYHVASMLPDHSSDPQRLEKKRHIGNDVVVFVFKESSLPLNPAIFKSEFNHIFIVIEIDRVEDGKTFYRVSVAAKDGFHAKPPLPYPPIFEKNKYFKEFILKKAINSERVAMYAPNFAAKIARTRKILFNEIAAKYNVINKDKNVKNFFSLRRIL
eukprot:TRINITY_DN4446_c0_g1_i1.p1 TRINITY_DN4446_c0_g1~~TRINITY_DN4446_c0_g1_i1.p1  ORF type:complete len:615 (-),score=133.39 TRINITY_DN4446_c0_g1_i1:193-1869(-)